MPVYMDSHEGTDLPDPLRSSVNARVTSGEPDEFGVIDRGLIMDKVANTMHCVLDAPDKEAVVRHHESLEVPIDRTTIHSAEAILR